MAVFRAVTCRHAVVVMTKESTSVDPLARPAQDGTAGDDAWYLQGENEGWDQTDPGGKR